jgi:hypothetical protein
LAPREDVPLAIGSLLTILWKYTLISWYQVDIDHKAFIKDTVWGQSIRRFAELCLVQLAKYRNVQARASARGAHEPTTKYNNEMQPLALITSDGTLQFSPGRSRGDGYIRRQDLLQGLDAARRRRDFFLGFVLVLAQTPVSVYLRHAVTYDGLAGTGGTAAGMTRREDAQGTATQCYCAL